MCKVGTDVPAITAISIAAAGARFVTIASIGAEVLRLITGEEASMRLRIEGLSWREIDGDLVILNLESSKYLTANRSAAILMKLLTADRTVEEMVAALVDSFGIAHARAEQDVSEFVELLARHKMLELA